MVQALLNAVRLPALNGAMEAGFGFADRLYRHDAAKLPYLLVVPLAVSTGRSVHRGWDATFNSTGCPLLRAAYDFFNVPYVAVLAHLLIVAHAIGAAVAFRITTFDTATIPFFLSSAAFKRRGRDVAVFLYLRVVSGAVSAYQTLLAAFRVAALNLTGIPLSVKAMVLARSESYEVFRGVIVMIAVLVVNVQEFFFRALATWNRAMRSNVRDLVRSEVADPSFKDSFNEKRITVNRPASVVHGAPATRESGLFTAVNRALFTLVFPSSFSGHYGKLNHS